MERLKLIDLLMDLNELLEKFDYYLKFDFSKSLKKVKQLLFLIDSASDDYIFYQQLDFYFLRHEQFDYLQIPYFSQNINFSKITKKSLVELLEDGYQKISFLDPYLKSIFIEEDTHIQNLLCIARYEGQYVSDNYLLNYINLDYLKIDSND